MSLRSIAHNLKEKKGHIIAINPVCEFLIYWKWNEMYLKEIYLILKVLSHK